MPEMSLESVERSEMTHTPGPWHLDKHADARTVCDGQHNGENAYADEIAVIPLTSVIATAIAAFRPTLLSPAPKEKRCQRKRRPHLSATTAPLASCWGRLYLPERVLALPHDAQRLELLQVSLDSLT